VRAAALLLDGEDVLLSTGPSWTALVGPVAGAVAVVAGCAAVLVAWTSAPGWIGWVLLAAVLWATVRIVAGVLGWRATVLAVTTDRVVYRAGVLRRVGREIPIVSVQDVSFHQGLFERLAGAGSVTVESAGERGASPFVDIPRPEAFQAAVQQAVSAARRPPGVMAGRGQGGLSRPTIPEQIEQLAALARRGVLTDAEFARKKAELLDRM
jgi:membrane protein YdbS with pleckstrin-like domain